MPQPVLVLLHGANVRRSTYRYLKAMANYFVGAGFVRTYPFHWNGSTSSKSINEAGEHLAETLDLLSRWFESGDGVDFRIFAKSTGGLVVRNALARMGSADRSPMVSTLLQVAVPNPPIESDILNIPRRIVNVYSSDDSFLQFFINIGLFPRHTKRLIAAPGKVINIEIPGMSHHDMNWNTEITQGELTGRTLYDLYLNILRGEAHEATCTSTP